MKTIQTVLIFTFLFFYGFTLNAQKLNNFSSKQDTLVLKTEKIKGFLFFDLGAGQIQFSDTTERNLYPVTFPKGISDIKLSWQYIDFKPFLFEEYKKGKSDARLFDFSNKMKIDTLNIPSPQDNYLSILSGKKGKDKIFIVDENNNKDFRDDSIRVYQKMDWHSIKKLILCKYKVYNGKELVEDSSWINIGTLKDSVLWFFVSHHLESAFMIDNQFYQIGIVDKQSNFCFDEPILTLLSQNGIKKDSLVESELINKGEYLKLKNTYYRFDDVSNDGKYVTLIKNDGLDSEIGTQVGMIAPDFNCRSIDGDSISLKDYNGKYLLLINTTACYSPTSSYNCYKDLTEKYKGKFEFLGIDNSTTTLKQKIKDLKLSGKFIFAEENKMIQKNYRPEFSSRTCFLINPEGRIVDKFEIFYWEFNLARWFGDKK